LCRVTFGIEAAVFSTWEAETSQRGNISTNKERKKIYILKK
jgi:hypothetical protein